MNQFDQENIWHPYAQIPNAVPTYQVESADGVYLNLKNNKRVVDGMSSWWSTIHGYNNPVLNQAVKSQLEKMAHVMFGGLTHKAAIDLAKKLIKITPNNLDKVFFADSGSIAVEVALKMSLQYWQNKDMPNKNKFITIYGGYHGDSFGAMSVCDPNSGMHHLFTGVLSKHYFVKNPATNSTNEALIDLESQLKNHQNEIAAMILEPIVQGAGGMRFYDWQYLSRAKQLCAKYNILLIIDEIATGFGRTGKLFACEFANIKPDILCLGKALTGGYMSLAATLTTSEIANSVGVLMHGPTFMANPLACAVANASIDLLLKSNWQERIKNIETILKKELLPLLQNNQVADVRVFGAIGVVEMIDAINVKTVQKKLIQQGVWLRPFGKLLYTMPAFLITDDELLKITSAINKVLND